jgi:hypothetical protein
MTRLGDGVWSALAMIPENPESKSKKKLTFNYHSGPDALTYGWRVTNEVIALASDVVQEELQVNAKDQPAK